MERRTLAEGVDVGVLGLGTVKLGRDRGVKYPDPFTIPDDDGVTALLRTARELGVNLLDTAPAYGDSEARLGALLARSTELGGRDAWVIATKVGEDYDPDTGSAFDFSPEAVRVSVERSLSRLRTDRLDVVLIHSDGDDLAILDGLGTLGALRDLQRAGKVRAVGMSTKTPRGALAAVERCDVVMLTLNRDERGDLPAIARANELGVGVLIKKALASGHAAKQGPQAVENAMKLCLGTPGVTGVVVGTINPAHLRANAAAAERACAQTGNGAPEVSP